MEDAINAIAGCAAFLGVAGLGVSMRIRPSRIVREWRDSKRDILIFLALLVVPMLYLFCKKFWGLW